MGLMSDYFKIQISKTLSEKKTANGNQPSKTSQPPSKKSRTVQGL